MLNFWYSEQLHDPCCGRRTSNQDFLAHLSQGTPYRSATHLTCAARQDVQLLTVRFPPVRFLLRRNAVVGGAMGRDIAGCLRGVLPFFSLRSAVLSTELPWSLGAIVAVD